MDRRMEGEDWYDDEMDAIRWDSRRSDTACIQGIERHFLNFETELKRECRFDSVAGEQDRCSMMMFLAKKSRNIATGYLI